MAPAPRGACAAPRTGLPPVSCSVEQWEHLASLAEKGAVLCCPTAAAFFEGLKQGLGWNVYETLLDFEVYTLELQRRDRAEARRGASSSSSSSSESDSSSSLDVNLSETQEAGKVTALDLETLLEGKDGEEVGPEQPKKLKTGRCTGFAMSEAAGARAVVTQTVDLPGILYGFGDFDCVLRLQLPSLEVLVYDSDGRLCPVGLNSVGLGVCVFNLHDRQTEGFEQASLSVQTLVWELLLAGHTLSSALSWLRSLPLRPMCGSALLLADETGVVNVELSPGGLVIGEVQRAAVVSRANHPMLEESEASFGGNKRSRRDSERRLEALRVELKRQQEADAFKLDTEVALSVLRRAKKVRNLSTLALVSMDPLQGQLSVEFRERQEVSETEAARFAVEMGMAPKILNRALNQGGLQMETKRPRMSTGETALHVTRWAKHSIELSAGKGKRTGELGELGENEAWSVYDALAAVSQSFVAVQ
ncbi:unnamed protein product [Effrenium voratum]|uniref:Uncharacterized protein n=1 Tax=Effrenium voratum TaxID=2562239 RepID=A0AA36IYJ6_9DINO|nr:unnamed protein product [Effrenium voratum]